MAIRSEYIGTVAALSAGVVWGFLGLLTRMSYEAGITTFQLTCLRYLIISLVILAFIFWKDKGMFRIDLKAGLILLLMGIVGTILNSVTYLESMKVISLSLASVLQYIAPFCVILISAPLLKEKITLNKSVAVVTAFIGCILCTGVISDPGSLNLWGIFLGSVSGLCFSIYVIGSKILSRDGYSISTVLFYTSVICWVGLAPFADLPSAIDIMSGSVHALALVVGMGLFVTLLPFVLFNYSLNRIEAGKASVLTYAEPVAATVIGLIIYQEGVSLDLVIGIVLILLALIVISRKDVHAQA